MTETQKELLQRISIALNEACLCFSMLKGYIEAMDAQQRSNDSNLESELNQPFYSEEELRTMPKLKDGCFRKTKDGYFQVRYRRNGYNVQFTSKNLNTVKEKFKKWVITKTKEENETNKALNDNSKQKVKKVETLKDFTDKYFTQVKKHNVTELTYKELVRKLNAYIIPPLGDLPINDITPLTCQKVLIDMLEAGKGRTAEDIKIMLGEIFRAALGERLITDNPMLFVKIPKHQRENGQALTPKEIEEFIEKSKNSPYHKIFMVYLYTGIRRNELHSAVIDDDFITVACGKRRLGQKQKYRKIPIANNLRRYLPLSEKELNVENQVLTDNFKKLCPNHHLYDLRHTFTTRTQESGIPKTLVDVWTGHNDSKDMTAFVYTHFTVEFHLKEIKKLDY